MATIDNHKTGHPHEPAENVRSRPDRAVKQNRKTSEEILFGNFLYITFRYYRHSISTSVGAGDSARPCGRRTRSCRGRASAAAVLLRETVLLSAAIRNDLCERAVQGHKFVSGIARKEVLKPWFQDFLLDTFGTAAKSVPCPGARNDPLEIFRILSGRMWAPWSAAEQVPLGYIRPYEPRKGCRHLSNGRGRRPARADIFK